MFPDDKNLVMTIISGGATARDAAIAAIKAAKQGNPEQAAVLIANATAAINAAQLAHNKLLSAEARGEGKTVSVLLVHAETHLTTAIAMRDMAREFIELYGVVTELRTTVGK